MPQLNDMQKIRKAVVVAVTVTCLAVLGFFALQLGGGFILGNGLAKQARTAEKEIQSYIETVEVSALVSS